MPREFASIAGAIGMAIREQRRPDEQPLPADLSALLKKLAERENQRSVWKKKKPQTEGNGRSPREH
jgi:hypothetical protein